MRVFMKHDTETFCVNENSPMPTSRTRSKEQLIDGVVCDEGEIEKMRS